MAINFPDSPGIGSVFTDTTSGFSYEWTGTLWKSFTASSVSNIQILDDISGSFDGIETTFNLTVSTVAATPVNAQQIEIILGGIQQSPGIDYTISGSTVIFTTAPTNGLTFSGKLLGTALSLNTIASGTDGSGLVSLNASELDSGTVPDARFPATLPAASGANLTDLNGSNIASGTVAAARVATLNQNTTGTAGGLTGTPDITVNNITGAAVTFTGNLNVEGVLTYEDVTNVDSVGLITARSGIICNGVGIGLSVPEGGVRVTGVCSATDFDTTSDVNLKENIHTVDNGLDLVNQLRGVRFDWKDTGYSTYGVIAQELEQVLPELVSDADPKTVKYNGIIGVLIEAVKELSDRVKALEDK